MNLSHLFVGIKRLGFALALGAGMIGCGVLTVDVDVYKGALVNEVHVQLHQLVAVATAAKPMLITLRNNHEWPDTDGVPPKNSDNCSGKNGHWYEHGYIPELMVGEKNGKVQTKSDDKTSGDNTEECGLKRPVARRVNRILHLYEDLASPDFAVYAKKLHEALERLQAAQSTLKADREKDQKVFDQIAKGLKPQGTADTEARPKDQLDKKDQSDKRATPKDTSNTECKAKPTSLLDAYRTLLVPGDEESGTSVRKVGELMDALQASASLGEKSAASAECKSEKKDRTAEGNSKKKEQLSIEEALIQGWKGTDVYKTKNDPYERRLPFRAVWKLLSEDADHPALTKQTKALFRDDDQGTAAYKRLNERIRDLVEAYWSSRQATRELWEESLHLLIQIDRLERNPERNEGKTDRYRSLKELAVNLVVELTSVRQVVSALDRVGRTNQCSLMQRAVDALGLLCNRSDSEKNALWTDESVRNDPERFERSLGRALTTDPEDTADFLLDLDRSEKRAIPGGDIGQLIDVVNQSASRRIVRLGLYRSYVDSDKQTDQARMVRSAGELTRILAGGFERGRLPRGIHALTEVYLKSHDGRISETSDDKDETKLLEALVEFAQKILFLANHEELVSPPSTNGLLLGGAEYLARGLLGDKLIDLAYTKTLPEYRNRSYVRVLQAVGNTILFSANELLERDRYREQGQKKVAAEVAAASSVYSPDPKKVLDDLLKDLENDRQAAQRTLADANARKAEIETRLGNPTANPKTGLYGEKDKTTTVLSQAETDLNNYRNSLKTLEAIHAVLTKDVITQVKSQWGVDKPKDEDDFLKGASGPSLKDALAVVRGSYNSTPPTKEDVQRWTDALNHVASSGATQAFADYRKRENQASLEDRPVLLDQFVSHIGELETKRTQGVARLEKIGDEKQAAFDRLEQDIVALNTEKTQLEKRIGEPLQKEATLQTAKEKIEAAKADVLKQAEKHGSFTSPKTIYGLLLSYLKDKEDLEQDPAKKKPYQDTQEVLLKRVPSSGVPPLDPNDFKSPREVMDAVIAFLRHHQMDVTQRFGQDSKESKRATEALENAYSHRAGMIYIRPSSAYLRTSFPSTSLQEDPNLAWDNMLLKQGLRNLPFSSELRDILNPSVKQDRTLTSELDKQYWQNINRVRVSGVGFSNQALVKDDVGNWYVKRYFGDTEDIAKSAKNLALFSLGAKMPIDLPRALRDASASKEELEKNPSTPTLQKVLEKHQGAYKTHTDEVKAKLERLHAKELRDTLIAAWEAHTDIKDKKEFKDSLDQALMAEIVVWDKMAATLKEKTDQDPGQAIVKDVGALSRLGRLLSAEIKKMPSSVASDPLKELAVAEVNKVVGSQVTDILTDRNRVLDQYEQAIVFIGDAANPKEAK
ncbi:exported hypothetical protein [Candidatus Nitrospira nitrosa]|uniref:Uncharacterized protein n=1 Tax=Candidatus Nitrospira nitrosa TaxID=1742972 RepID=A0A0S4LET6_9BACT|nr:hypothetical protein [Candidatus Nitrospira nitrosa]CUS35406.1 exported hypothetical protein [Candidatus Nitrospira nitrosa]